ncbi:MAG: hypothetical protein J6V80_00745 [Clostridia bacterium]|nr:hypothetical protein [Clostridia bacterium]
MLYTELTDELVTLGADPTNESLFIYSTNRALRDFYNTRRILRTARIVTKGLTPITRYKELDCSGGPQVRIPLNGMAYSMRAHGKGQFMIRDGGSSRVQSVDSEEEATLIRGFIISGGEITFWSSFAFTIYDLCMYDRIFSDKLDSIPDGATRAVIDLREKYGDFMSFDSMPRDSEGNIISDCRLYDGKLEIASDFSGEILLTYRRLPLAIAGYDNEKIDIPEEYKHLFPLLVAYYVMLDTNESRAKLYKNLYEDGLSRLDKRSYTEIDPAYVTTNGWA